QEGVFQEQEEQKGQEPAADVIAFAELAKAGYGQGQAEPAEGETGQQRRLSPVRLLKRSVDEQAEVKPFEDVFRLKPPHGRSRPWCIGQSLVLYVEGIASGRSREVPVSGCKRRIRLLRLTG